MNKVFYENLDINFEQALKMSEQEFSHEELLIMLKEGNIPQKQIAALKLDAINNKEEATILISNLTGCDGKIREAVALKINKLISLDDKLINYFNEPEIFANASIDINANICRLVIDTVAFLKKDSLFADKYLEKILCFINEAFKELDNFIFRDKKYVINKQLFKLYWCFEALKLFVNELDDSLLLPILERAYKEREYTIREKVAQIVSLSKNEIFNPLKKLLEGDENYYVRNAL